jgi:hypothetical protein
MGDTVMYISNNNKNMNTVNTLSKFRSDYNIYVNIQKYRNDYISMYICIYTYI